MCAGVWELGVIMEINNMCIRLATIVLTMFILTSCSQDGYRIEGDKVVYEVPWNAGNFTVIKELKANPETFEVMGDDNLTWAKDDKKVFRRYTPIENIDSATFEVLSINFAKDKDKVICGRDIIKETNPADFKVQIYRESNGYIYIYGVDKNAAYLCSTEPKGYRRIQSNAIDSFEQLEDVYYKDNEKVWWSTSELSGANPKTFKVLSGGYATDGTNVYYGDDKLKGVDASTFKVDSSYRAHDKNYKYYFDDKVKSLQSNEQLISIEILNDLHNLVKVETRLSTGEKAQAWDTIPRKIKSVKIRYKGQVILQKKLGNKHNKGMSSGASTVDYGLVIDDKINLSEIDSLLFSWIESKSGTEREVTVDVKGLIPEDYNGGVLYFKIKDIDQVVADFDLKY